MFGGVNPKQMAGMMKKMGISQNQLPVKRVVFEMDDGNLIIDDPNVMKISMQGQVSYQVTGEEREESAELFSDEDVEMVSNQTGAAIEDVKAALEEAEGDIAEAIMALKE